MFGCLQAVQHALLLRLVSTHTQGHVSPLRKSARQISIPTTLSGPLLLVGVQGALLCCAVS
jgi:hypothetical protein